MHVAGYGDLMKVAAEFTVPAVDTGIPNPPEYATYMYRHIKFLSSAAAWRGRDDVIVLYDPIVGGAGTGRVSPAPPLMYNITNMSHLHGANIATTYAPLDRLDQGTTQGAGYEQADYQAFARYNARLASVLRGARRETAVAVYYPVNMFQADYLPRKKHWSQIVPFHQGRQYAWDRVGETLEKADIDYQIVHPEAVRDAEIDGDLLKIGTGAYRYLVLPQVEFISRDVLEKIRLWESQGGKAIWVGSVARQGIRPEEDAEVARLAKPYLPAPVEDIAPRITNPYGEAYDLTFNAVPTEYNVATSP